MVSFMRKNLSNQIFILPFFRGFAGREMIAEVPPIARISGIGGALTFSSKST